MTYEEYNTAKDKLVSLYSRMTNNNMRNLDTKTETFETKDVVIDHPNFVLKNCVCSPRKSIHLIQKIDILNSVKIENYCGSLSNLRSVVCGTYELVNYINPTPGGLILLGAPNVIFKKCTDLGFMLDSANRSISMYDSSITLNFQIGNKIEMLIIKNTTINNFSGQQFSEKDAVVKMEIDNSHIPQNLYSLCSEELIESNITDFKEQQNVNAQRVKCEHCENIVLNIESETSHVVLEQCKKCSVAIKVNENVQIDNCENIHIVENKQLLPQNDQYADQNRAFGFGQTRPMFFQNQHTQLFLNGFK
ncbi:hypothetical protein EIN_119630 [Entamoeba invadens IP1]|uniref:C-CAP/cofactor C-like domain-containing protein n=1 Tax=Entamoeba invadens IP1 TaxID=370355 RepID=L7FNN3_ENTIV|nr:hypothetical protein EIN_119630 [Entamoeba invadens IP1]ELP92289.1 hypothetical protein EIN_119630 [Entamoeba invadens IP1]|eukprot:XP_004259060.1 hypothetical protein EIN_119630 [Entamoeba invadens IP1]